MLPSPTASHRTRPAEPGSGRPPRSLTAAFVWLLLTLLPAWSVPVAAAAPPAMPGPLAANPPSLELLTMGPGDTLFDGFGHAALRVIDPVAGTDLVYTFGAVSWTGPLLGWHFLRGEVLFKVRVRPFGRVLRNYRQQDRTLFRQPLRLLPAEARTLAELLRINARPENSSYRYHHFDDNCATRPRDLIDRVTGGALRRALQGPWRVGASRRDLVLEGLSRNPALLLIMNVVLGRPTDPPVSRWDSTFVPRRLREELAGATRSLGTRTVPLADPPQTVYARRAPLHRWPIGWGAGIALGLAVIAGLAGAALARRHRRRQPPTLAEVRLAGGGLLLWALVGGVLGLVLDTVALSDAVPEFSRNENLLLFTGLDLLLVAPAVAWLAGRNLQPRLLRALAGWFALRGLLAALIGLGQATGLLLQRPLALALLVTCVQAGLALAAWRLAGGVVRPGVAAEPGGSRRPSRVKAPGGRARARG